MNKKFLCLCFVLLFFSCFTSKSLVLWHNTNITTDVTDEDIDIIGTNTIIGGISVSALGSDVSIAVTAEDSILTGSGESQLYLQVENGNTITFNLSKNLTFKGSNGGMDLLITVSGNGLVLFNLGNGTRVEFTSQGASGGTRLFLRMQNGVSTDVVFFSSDSTIDENNVEIVIGPKSIISYMALETDIASGNGIWFAPKAGVGRMILKIEDTGGFYIGGNKLDDVANPTLKDIHMDLPAGRTAIFGLSGFPFSSLLVLNSNNIYTDLLANPWRQSPDPFAGNRYGFVMGPNSLMNIFGCYLDYVGLTNNFCPTPDIPENVLDGKLVSEVVKKRNPSAFIVDGASGSAFVPASILAINGGIYFRSGVDKDGIVTGTTTFTVDKDAITSGEGEIVFDIEGELTLFGAPNRKGLAIQVLSLEVTPTGGYLVPTSDLGFPIAPRRTFAKDVDGDYITYNKAAVLINNIMNLALGTLVHTDELHVVCENNDIISEPTYVGGETFLLSPTVGRPTIQFFNSDLNVYMDIAFTGVDLLVPNAITVSGVPLIESNISRFTFFSNGYKIDNGSGRNMILGTNVGATACDGCTIISNDAHLDVFQTIALTDTSNIPEHKLILETDCNNDEIIEI